MSDNVVPTEELERLPAELEEAIADASRSCLFPRKCEHCDAVRTLAAEVLAGRKWETQAREALEAWAEWELTLEGVDYQITPPNGLADVKKLGRDALDAKVPDGD